MSRLSIPKTYKLYIGGKFPRSESGRTYEIASSKGAFLANASKASRKDARDAVVAARAAVGGGHLVGAPRFAARELAADVELVGLGDAEAAHADAPLR